MKKIWLNIIAFFILMPTIVFAQNASSTGLKSAFGSNSVVQQTASSSYETGNDFTSMLSDIILLILSLIGVVFMAYIIFAGWLWMSAGGNEQKVEKAKGILIQSIIGLIIIIGAYAISYFVIRIFNSQFKTQ
jgi:hypothetical protein